MKKLVITLLLLSLLFNSCVVNDTFDDDLIINMEGTWRLTSFKIGIPEDFDGDGNASDDLVIETGCYNNETMVFNSNNTGVNISRSFADIEVTIVTGTTDQVDYNVQCVDDPFEQNFSWTRNDATLTLNFGGTVYVGNVNLNGNLYFVVPNGYVIDQLQNGSFVTVEQDISFTYSKE